MLLSRDYVGYMAKEVVKRLLAAKMIQTKNVENLSQQVRQVMADEVTVEDRVNEEVREMLALLACDVREQALHAPGRARSLRSEENENCAFHPDYNARPPPGGTSLD